MMKMQMNNLVETVAAALSWGLVVVVGFGDRVVTWQSSSSSLGLVLCQGGTKNENEN